MNARARTHAHLLRLCCMILALQTGLNVYSPRTHPPRHEYYRVHVRLFAPVCVCARSEGSGGHIPPHVPRLRCQAGYLTWPWRTNPRCQRQCSCCNLGQAIYKASSQSTGPGSKGEIKECLQGRETDLQSGGEEQGTERQRRTTRWWSQTTALEAR